MLLEQKNAVVYGGGGAIGGAVALAFAREGTRVFLTGRIRESLERVYEEIRSAGGAGEVAVVDALDEKAVDEHADAVVAETGSLDISFNLISYGDVPVGGHVAGRLRTADLQRGDNHIPNRPSGRASHDQKTIRGDPNVRGGGGPAP